MGIRHSRQSQLSQTLAGIRILNSCLSPSSHQEFPIPKIPSGQGGEWVGCNPEDVRMLSPSCPCPWSSSQLHKTRIFPVFADTRGLQRPAFAAPALALLLEAKREPRVREWGWISSDEDLGFWGAGIGEGDEVLPLNPKPAQFVHSSCPEQGPGGI